MDRTIVAISQIGRNGCSVLPRRRRFTAFFLPLEKQVARSAVADGIAEQAASVVSKPDEQTPGLQSRSSDFLQPALCFSAGVDRLHVGCMSGGIQIEVVDNPAAIQAVMRELLNAEKVRSGAAAC